MLFLTLRSQELVPGGEGVFLMVGFDGEKSYSGFDAAPGDGRGIVSLALERAVAKNFISEKKSVSAEVNYWFRTEADIGKVLQGAVTWRSSRSQTTQQHNTIKVQLTQ